MTSFEAAFGQGAQNIAESLSRSTGRAKQAVNIAMERANQWMSAGYSAIPHKRALGIASGVGVGLAVVLSQPPPSLGVSANAPTPDMTSGTGGYNIPNKVHPMPRAVGSPSAPNLASMANTARVSPSFNVSISGRARRGVDTGMVSNQIRSVLGGNTSINTRLQDERRSLNSQNVADILSGG